MVLKTIDQNWVHQTLHIMQHMHVLLDGKTFVGFVRTEYDVPSTRRSGKVHSEEERRLHLRENPAVQRHLFNPQVT